MIFLVHLLGCTFTIHRIIGFAMCLRHMAAPHTSHYRDLALSADDLEYWQCSHISCIDNSCPITANFMRLPHARIGFLISYLAVSRLIFIFSRWIE